MPADIVILLIVIVVGATTQAGVGVGFSIFVAPVMMVMLGTSTAVPVLLMLNTLVSAVALDRKIWILEKTLIKSAVLGCLAGIILGLGIYPYLSEQIVLSLTATLLLVGVVSSAFPMRVISKNSFRVVSALSGLATVWAATPGPLMVFALLAVGRSAREARKLVHPVSLVAYGVAFALHSVTDWKTFAEAPWILQFSLAAFIGGILGRFIGPHLPQQTITISIRVISVVACVVLFRSAYLAGE
ncbi:MAG: TSUP family transporter [Planctomycetota bacterium]